MHSRARRDAIAGRLLGLPLASDPYCYEVAVMFVGVRNHRERLTDYRRGVAMLLIRVARPAAVGEAEEKMLVYY